MREEWSYGLLALMGIDCRRFVKGPGHISIQWLPLMLENLRSAVLVPVLWDMYSNCVIKYSFLSSGSLASSQHGKAGKLRRVGLMWAIIGLLSLHIQS